jgi:hypothetical protein
MLVIPAELMNRFVSAAASDKLRGRLHLDSAQRSALLRDGSGAISRSYEAEPEQPKESVTVTVILLSSGAWEFPTSNPLLEMLKPGGRLPPEKV